MFLLFMFIPQGTRFCSGFVSLPLPHFSQKIILKGSSILVLVTTGTIQFPLVCFRCRVVVVSNKQDGIIKIFKSLNHLFHKHEMFV